MIERHDNQLGGLREYALALLRHKFLIVAAIVLTTGLTLAFSLHQRKLYQASVQVYLNTSNPAQLLSGGGAVTEADANPARVVANQSTIATSPRVLNAAVQALHLTGGPAATFRGSATVSGNIDRDVLLFQSKAPTPAAAARDVNALAAAYARYQQMLVTSTLSQATAGVTAQLAKAQSSSRSAADRSLRDQLLAKQEQLKTLQTLQTAQAVVLGPSTSAALVQPKTSRNVLLGGILGLLLGVGAAFVRDAFDRRIRDADQVAAALGLPLLGRIPPPPKRIRSQSHLVMQDAPFGLPAEAFRMLRTNLDFETLDHEARMIVVTSAVAREGKTTTVSNLALTYARAGLRVALVDLDLRRPGLKRYFPPDSDEAMGITDVALGRASLNDVMFDVPLQGLDNYDVNANGDTPLAGPASDSSAPGPRATLTKEQGSLAILPAGTIPPNIGEFVGGGAIAAVLAEVQAQVDLVLIDTPPLLTFSDAATIIRRARGVLLITRLNLVTRTELREAQRLLVGAGDGQRLGFVITGADEDENYGKYDRYSYGYSKRQYSSVDN